MKTKTIINITMSKEQLDTLVQSVEGELDNNGTDLDLARLYGKLKDTQESAEAAATVAAKL